MLLASCGLPENAWVEPRHDAGAAADASKGLDARDPRLPDLDASIDAPPDADPSVPDTTPPQLVGVTPTQNASIWLHAPIHVAFDEPLDSIAGTHVAATLGGATVAAAVSLEAPETITITLPAGTRGVGALVLHVDVAVTDKAGNQLTTTIDTSLFVPAWHSAGTDRGYVEQPTPALSVGSRGSVVAAWTVGGVGAHRAVVSELAGSSWRSLGGLLGVSDAGSASVAHDADGTPVVAYTDGGIVHVARWNGSQWDELPSPGSAFSVKIAAHADGPVVAMFGSSITVQQLVGDAWQSLGADITLTSPCTGEPALAATASTIVAGCIDATSQLRAFRRDTTWTALASLAVSAGSRMSLAARGTTVAVAWDRWAGSFGVLAAVATSGATTWAQLGKPLDIDISGDARGPSIVIDAGGAPIIAWYELVETAERGALARWNGSTWTIVGGVSWLPSISRARGTQLVLDASGAAIIATNNGGDLHVARFNGPATAALGIAKRSALTGCTFDADAPPSLLSHSGCFALSQANNPVAHAGLVPYDINAELWSDGAKKRRWIGLPDGEAMTLASNGSWVPPVGTILVKEFALELSPGDPSTRKPVETRFLVNDPQLGWQGFTYRWNVAGTDASLLNDGQYIVNWQLTDGSQHAHVYPSRAHCRSCHTTSHGPALGLRPEQLARWADYGGVIADQLPTLVQLGIGPSSTPPAFTSPHDPSATAERRMRGYMHANCAHCHNPQYLSVKDLRFATPLASTKLCETITPGSPSESRVYQLVTTRPGMPALGTVAVDPLADELLGTWIRGMAACP